VQPPLHPQAKSWRRDIAPGAIRRWLAAGWRDLVTRPAPSLLYGLFVFAVSVTVVWCLFAMEYDYLLFPALAGFMVVGPVLEIGLYEKSRRLAAGEPVRLRDMVFVRPRSGGQVLFTGVLLCGLMLLWMRAAVILYALFFGVRPFPGLDHIAEMLFTTPTGWAMLAVGWAVGALFGGFAFAISAFSIPMLLAERTDALTAMGTSFALVWHNRGVLLIWIILAMALFLLSVATGLVGLIIVFPWLGHAMWHAYRDIAQ